MLAEHWRRLRGSWGRLLLLVVGGAIVLQVVISLVQSVNPWAYSAADAASAGGASAGGAAAEATIDPVTASGALLAVAVYATLGPLVMALIEDIVFRYTLLHRLYLPRVWLRVLLVVGGGILFGAVLLILVLRALGAVGRADRWAEPIGGPSPSPRGEPVALVSGA